MEYSNVHIQCLKSDHFLIKISDYALQKKVPAFKLYFYFYFFSVAANRKSYRTEWFNHINIFWKTI